MWEYKITKSEFGYNVVRVDEDRAEYYSYKRWTKDRNLAQTFLRQGDVEAALVLLRRKGEERLKESSEKSVSQSWSEYCS